MRPDQRIFTKSLLLEEVFGRRRWKRSGEISDLILERHYPDLATPQYTAAEVAAEIKKSRCSGMFVQLMNELQTQELYVSYIHGQSHIERVAVLSARMAADSLSEELFALCIECAKYHDVGRRDDSRDPAHGARGAEKIDRICAGYSEGERARIRAVIAAHSLDDQNAGDVFRNYGITDAQGTEDCRKLLRILKDADALDRFRLNNYSLNPRMLRGEDARHLIRAACEMVNL